MNDIAPLIFPGRTAAAPIVIAGPCSAESYGQVMATAAALAADGIGIFRAGLWKPRTKPGCFEGVGAEGLAWLREVKARTGMLTATEVATPEHAEQALAAGIDVIWIGSRTSANPFAVQALADAIGSLAPDTTVLVKNPLSPDLELWIGAIERMYNAGVRHLGAVHRGFGVYGSHPYRNMPIWHIPIELHRRLPQMTLLCDPSHIGGRRELIEPLSQQALDMGFDGLIIESHCCPDCALSDSGQQLTPSDLARVLGRLVTRRAQAPGETLELLREQIDRLDTELLDVLNRRMAVSRQIGSYKKEHGMSIVQIDRHDKIMQRRIADAERMGMDTDFIRRILSAIHQESVRQQM